MATLNDSRQELTQEQLQIIANEISKPEYKDISPGGICKLLNDKLLIANPSQQGTINGPNIELMEILITIGATRANVIAIKENPEGLKSWNILKDLNSLDLNSQLVVDCFTTFAEEGLVPQAKVDLVFALGQIPNPNWQAQIEQDSIGENILDSGWAMEGSDIRTAQTL
ncbi:MAG: hypothetical protein V3U75_13145 [Methylococcaceae bacterium]